MKRLGLLAAVTVLGVLLTMSTAESRERNTGGRSGGGGGDGGGTGGGSTAVTADNNASPITQAVLSWLKTLPDLSTNHLVVGAFTDRFNGETDYCHTNGWCDNPKGVHDDTGYWPGLASICYNFTPPGGVTFALDDQGLIDYWNNHGLIELMWEPPNPAACSNTTSEPACPPPDSGDAWNTTTPVNLAEVINSGTQVGTRYKAWLDQEAAHIATLEAAGAIVLFRPLPEMNKRWFWWGTVNKNTASQYINLWRYTFNYLTSSNGVSGKNLHNILFVWAADSDMDSSYYPGDDYVDIVGVDHYSSVAMGTVGGYSKLSTTYGNKVFAITEYGACGGDATVDDCDPQDISSVIASIKTNMPKTAYLEIFDYVFSMNYNQASPYYSATKIMTDPWVITRDEMPSFADWTTYPTLSLSTSTLSPSCQVGNDAATQTFQVRNSGSGELSYTITDNAAWLSVSPTTGTSTGGYSTITVTYSTSTLAAGDYSATLTVSASGALAGPQTIAVNLTVSPTGGIATANNFAADDNCIAWWKLDSGALTTDSKSTNALTNNGVTSNTSDYRQGTGSGTFNSSETNYETIADSSLASGFPLKCLGTNCANTTAKTLSVSLWFKASAFPTSGNKTDLFSKFDAPGDARSIRGELYNVRGNTRIYLAIGYSGGAEVEEVPTNGLAYAVSTNTWYHVTFTFRDSDKSYAIYLRDTHGNTLADTSGNTMHNIAITNAPFVIGGQHGSPYYNLFDGLIDEVLVFHDLVTASEATTIAKGQYDPTRVSNSP
jgi:hypothetical protein